MGSFHRACGAQQRGWLYWEEEKQDSSCVELIEMNQVTGNKNRPVLHWMM